MTSPQSVAIVGGGMGGFSTAHELRRRGYEGPISILDPYGTPYDRPPLSKEYFLQERSAEEIHLIKEDWYAENNVEVVPQKAVSIHPHEGVVVAEDGTKIPGEVIVLATGGVARKLHIPGNDLDTVLQLRTKEDSDKLREAIAGGKRLTIIGAGLIGAEVASSALKHGATVTLIDPAETPLIPAVGETLAKRLHGMHADKGITVVQGIPLEIFVDENGTNVRVESGETYASDVVLVGIGIIPLTDLAEDAGLEEDNGTLVDEAQRTTHPNVYAVGDSSRTRLRDGTLLRRAEHWEHAMNTGKTAAAAILGQDLPVHSAPWFWSDRHGVHVEGVGTMWTEHGETVIREVDGVPAAAFRLNENGELVGCAAIDDALAVRAARRIIDKKIPVDPAQLADSSINLKKLAK
ncbi:NAD(P)/FAD-dependent oxidoreductase [Neomicrococcus lactis]|uniref:NADPH-dependent 2,4-dienoyl-CoA reductase/sulfur reductase-like enzyme n=1 Tax=Neomicrococcus lactis TaxID=732241 RepID=A0A7W8YCI6_9MICC|nr:FAD-dependent oxidoreductase [Neomicrococcus lactis]MBB5599036.1 NADPH-dependent 2,4-dienoyl-CoA reductase/sulfur reductase-like enzyme [Neomicrococcus lactis]